MNLSAEMRLVLPEGLTSNDVYFVCVGTDRSTGDSLGALVGTYLKEYGYENVVGAIDDPVHALNLVDTIENLPKDKIIIGIDASLGEISSIGRVEIKKGKLKAGEGVGKNLPAFGDYKITGIVNVSGFMEYFVLQNTRLSLVMNMAREIADSINEVLPIEEELQVSGWRNRIGAIPFFQRMKSLFAN